MNIVEIHWPAAGRMPGPIGAGYHLLAALCRAGMVRHDEPGMQILIDQGLLVRCGLDRARQLEDVANLVLDVGGCSLRLARPTIRSLRPATTLLSRMVTIKGKLDDVSLRKACASQLNLLSASADVRVGRRRVLRVREHLIVGYEVELRCDPVASLAIQARGLGGRMRMGCGVFVPC